MLRTRWRTETWLMPYHSVPLLWGPVGSDALKHVSEGCPTNAQSDLSLEIALATPWRRCLPAPGRLGRLCPCEVAHCRASGQNPDLKPRKRVVPPVQGLHLNAAVNAPPSMTTRSVRPSRQMPPHTITGPPSCRSYSTMLLSACRSPSRLHALTRRSQVETWNLDSSVKRMGRQWRSCQCWWSWAKSSRALRCSRVRMGPRAGVCCEGRSHGVSCAQFGY